MRRLIAGVLIATAVLAGCSTKPLTIQQRADAAAQAVTPLIKASQAGTDTSAQGATLVRNLEAATHCKVTGIVGGPIPTDSTRPAFISQIDVAVKGFIATHPGAVMGRFDGPDFGALIALDCSGGSA